MSICKSLNKVLVALLLAAGLIVPAVAQDSFIAKGVGYNYKKWSNGQETTHFAVLFEVEITYDAGSLLWPYSSNQANFHWYDPSLSFALTVHDLGGQLLDQQFIAATQPPTGNYFPAAFVFANAAGSIEKFGFRVPEIPQVTNFSASVTWFPPAGSLPFAPVYPDWQWGELPGTGNTISIRRGGLLPQDGDFQFTGFVSDFGSGDDGDGDGIADGADACPDSDLSATVVFNGVDTGVVNTLDAGGCTLADRLAEATGDARNHGQLVRATGAFLSDLMKAGEISGQERGALLNAIAQTNR